MKKILFSFIILLLSIGPLYPQNTQGESGNPSQGELNILNNELPPLEVTEPFAPFRPFLPIRAWENWNENRPTQLQVVNPILPFQFRYISRRPAKSFVFVSVGTTDVSSSVVSANSASFHYNVLQDDSANYGVELTKKHNFVLIFEGVARPQDDFNSYGVIFINRKKIGMTTKGLITQRKVFRTNLDLNRHLLKIKIVVQDEYRRSWTTLMNTQQPREKYFPVKKGYITVVKMTYRPDDRNEKYSFIGKFVKMSSLQP